MPTSSTSVKHSISTLTIPFENRSFKLFTSFITLTSSLPALRVSKNEKLWPCMCLNRSSLSFAMARRPEVSMSRMRFLVHSIAVTLTATMPSSTKGTVENSLFCR